MNLLSRLQRSVALLLCFLLSPLPLLSQQTATQAGDVSALVPAATRNGATASLRDSVLWNDTLKTDHNGRMRVALRDGSNLSLGSESELKVVQHDPVSQQTTLQMLFGRVRAQVVKITQPGGKFEVNTPHASLGVIGTDFYVEVAADRTIVIVYSGLVLVTALGAAAATAGAAAAQGVQVTPGHMVQVTNNGVGPLQTAPKPVVQDSMTQTLVGNTASNVATTAATTSSHVLRSVLIGLAAAGASVGAGIAIANSTKGPSTPPKPPSIPPQ
jgi:ferric-dicitrate binding protein FerR (iron transport regulator)